MCAWLEWLGDSGCFGGWEFDGDRGLLKWESRIVCVGVLSVRAHEVLEALYGPSGAKLGRCN